MSNDMFNGSGCKDTTAYQAINSVDNENRKLDKKAYDTIKLAKQLIKICGFELLERIAIVDTDSGKEFR